MTQLGQLATVVNHKETQEMAINIMQDLESFELGKITINEQD